MTDIPSNKLTTPEKLLLIFAVFGVAMSGLKGAALADAIVSAHDNTMKKIKNDRRRGHD